jgi:UDP-N-acetylglucosamine transferase subunit ALG13
VIFVTVASMFPFDRLVRTMDNWAAAHPGTEVLAQIGDGPAPAHMRWQRRLDRDAFGAAVRRAQLVVAHAGVGSVVTACAFGTPAVVLPRRQSLGEHTSDHQVETANWLRGKSGIHVADAEGEIAARIAEALAADAAPHDVIGQSADPAFLARIRGFVCDQSGSRS